MSVRRLAWLLGVGVLGAVLAFRSGARTEVGADAATAMRSARAYFDSLAVAVRRAPDADHVPPASAIALGYLERLRLGEGSPFRLIDFALHDPRLSDDMRSRVAWALLDRTLRGDDYQVDPRVLDGAGVRDTSDGAVHTEFITRVVERAPNAREGELAVRLAYSLSAGEGTLNSPAVMVAAQVAALARDRRLAREDAWMVFRRARADQLSPFEEVPRLRSTRAFAVEAPAAVSLTADEESSAVADARALVDSLRHLGRGSSGDSQARSLLGVAAAQRLAQLGAGLPWESAVAVTLGSYRPLLVSESETFTRRVSRQRFADGALNEETLPAMYALLRAGGDTGAVPARAVLAVATALRAFAQESPWFPGSSSAGVTEADLRRDFGVAGVKFDHDVPTAWRPYYLAQIRTAIGDLHRVLPAMSVEGVHIRFGIDGLPDSALAMHDPATRTVHLSIRSSTGTLAHEFAHDLDWQAARRLYEAGGYGTDQAARDGTGPLSEPVLALTARQGVSWRGASAAGAHNESSERPAELFARGMDWFVASSLAAEGRSDGYLTSAQDALLAGYASASPAAISPQRARALMTAASRMTFVPEALRDHFLTAWADPSNADVFVLVERVMGTWPVRRTAAVAGPMLPGTPDLPSTSCVDVPGGAPTSVRARAELLDVALDARARGIAVRRASWYPWSRRPAWAHAVLGEAPWSADGAASVLQRIRNGVAAELASTVGTLGPLQESFPTFRLEAANGCGG